jgi:hypothetical protein
MNEVEIKVRMRPVKTTPGTYLFEAVDKLNAGVKNVYVQKSAYPNGAPPAEVEVTVREVKL